MKQPATNRRRTLNRRSGTPVKQPTLTSTQPNNQDSQLDFDQFFQGPTSSSAEQIQPQVFEQERIRLDHTRLYRKVNILCEQALNFKDTELVPDGISRSVPFKRLFHYKTKADSQTDNFMALRSAYLRWSMNIGPSRLFIVNKGKTIVLSRAAGEPNQQLISVEQGSKGSSHQLQIGVQRILKGKQILAFIQELLAQFRVSEGQDQIYFNQVFYGSTIYNPPIKTVPHRNVLGRMKLQGRGRQSQWVFEYRVEGHLSGQQLEQIRDGLQSRGSNFKLESNEFV